jgi:hypothetical protein
MDDMHRTRIHGVPRFGELSVTPLSDRLSATPDDELEAIVYQSNIPKRSFARLCGCKANKL